jgi:hypothetical protein
MTRSIGGRGAVVPAANTSCLYANHSSRNSLPHALSGHAENSCHEDTQYDGDRKQKAPTKISF